MLLEMNKLKIVGYVCQSDPFKDRGAWSGTIYKLREAIEKSGYRVVWIPYRANSKVIWLLSHFLRVFNSHSILYASYPLYLRSCAKSIDLQLLESCDILFFPGLAGIMKYVATKKPFIYFSDATFSQMVDYYWFGLDKLTRRIGNACEAWTIDNCCMIISSSHWAAQSAEVDYGCNPDKNFVIPFGANLDDKDLSPMVRTTSSPLKLLFSGVEWERKGASIAIDAVCELNRRGIDAKLLLCGIREIPSDYGQLPDCVEYLGFLNKNNPDEYRKYVNAVKESMALVLPTKAECSAIVFCEAAGNGLPVFTYDTGGIGDYVVNGKNGYRLPLDATAKEFADVIEQCIVNNQIPALSSGAVDHYKKSLNWDSWASSFKVILDNYFSSQNGE